MTPPTHRRPDFDSESDLDIERAHRSRPGIANHSSNVMAKKKRVVANPARGFSTTSVPSKQSLQSAPTQDSVPPALGGNLLPREKPLKEKKEATATESTSDDGPSASKLTQSELEALQKSVQAQRSRILTEYRLSRLSARSLNLTRWMSRAAETRLTEIAKDIAANFSIQCRPSSDIDRDSVAKALWTTEQLLSLFGIPAESSIQALSYIPHLLPVDELSPQDVARPLGLALEYLILRDPTLAISNPTQPLFDQGGEDQDDFVVLEKPKLIEDTQDQESVSDSVLADVRLLDGNGIFEGLPVSELDPDELIPVWLSLQSRILEIEVTRSTSIAKAVKAKLVPHLTRIESDVLFDRKEAEELWKTERLEVYARRQRYQPPTPAPVVDNESGSSEGSDDEAELSLFDEKEVSLLPSTQSSVSQLKHLDFGSDGPGTGVSPQTLLSESAKSIDPDAVVSVSWISKANGICQSAAAIRSSNMHWHPVEVNDIVHVEISQRPGEIKFEMKKSYCSTTWQSHSYVSAVALAFLVHSHIIPIRTRLRLSVPWIATFDQAKDEFDSGLVGKVDARMDEITESVMSVGEILVLPHGTTTGDADSWEVVQKASDSNKFTKRPPSKPQDIWRKRCGTPSFHRMQAGRAALPIFEFKKQIISTLDTSRVLLISGEPGCGKSTQVPAYILEHELAHNRECRIMCTQPRRISAVSLACRVRDELGEDRSRWPIESLVGYIVRFENDTSPESRVIYSTVGVVFRMLESDPELKQVTHLVVDEVHERSLDTDFLLLVIKRLLDARPDLKVILMSATIDAAKFASYMGGCPVLSVPGRTFPVQAFFIEDAIERTGYSPNQKRERHTSDSDFDDFPRQKSGVPSSLFGYTEGTLDALQKLDEYSIDNSLIVHLIYHLCRPSSKLNQFSDCFLVFLPGMAEINSLEAEFRSAIQADGDEQKWKIHVLHSSVSSDRQQLVFERPSPGQRKLVLSTNIAETGVTIPDVTCVIDAGKHREQRFDEKGQTARLIDAFISRANAFQRRGRAGRMREGICFHLFTRHRFETMMSDYPVPEALRLSLRDILSRVQLYGLGAGEEALSNLLDPPSSRRVIQATRALIESNITTRDGHLTTLGRQALKLPVDTVLAKLCLFSAIVKCLDFGITIAALLSLSSVFIGSSTLDRCSTADPNSTESDVIALYKLYSGWRQTARSAGQSGVDFCNRNRLHYQRLIEAEEMKHQLLLIMSELGLSGMSTTEAKQARRQDRTTSLRFVECSPASSTNVGNKVLLSALTAWAFYPNIVVRTDGPPNPNDGWRSLVHGGGPISVPAWSVAATKRKSKAESDDRKDRKKPSSGPSMLSFFYLRSTADGTKRQCYYNTPIDPSSLAVFLPFFDSIKAKKVSYELPPIPSLLIHPDDPVRFDPVASNLVLRPVGRSVKVDDSGSALTALFRIEDVSMTARLHLLRQAWLLHFRSGLDPDKRQLSGSAHKVLDDLFEVSMMMFKVAAGEEPEIRLV